MRVSYEEKLKAWVISSTRPQFPLRLTSRSAQQEAKEGFFPPFSAFAPVAVFPEVAGPGQADLISSVPYVASAFPFVPVRIAPTPHPSALAARDRRVGWVGRNPHPVMLSPRSSAAADHRPSGLRSRD